VYIPTRVEDVFTGQIARLRVCARVRVVRVLAPVGRLPLHRRARLPARGVQETAQATHQPCGSARTGGAGDRV